jgi:hypothetical protein
MDGTPNLHGPCMSYAQKKGLKSKERVFVVRKNKRRKSYISLQYNRLIVVVILIMV